MICGCQVLLLVRHSSFSLKKTCRPKLSFKLHHSRLCISTIIVRHSSEYCNVWLYSLDNLSRSRCWQQHRAIQNSYQVRTLLSVCLRIFSTNCFSYCIDLVLTSFFSKSGLWGIFWYREITGCERVSKWFGAAILTVIGILWLSYERIAAKEQTGDHRFLEALMLSPLVTSFP